MSEHKKPHNEPVSKAPIIVSESPRKVSPKLLLAAVVALLIVGVIALVYRYKDHNSQQNQGSNAVNNLSPAGKVDYYTNTGNYANAEKILKGQLSSAKNNTDKANVYAQLASLNVHSHKYSAAMNYAKQADSLVPTSSSSGLLGNIAQAQSDAATAKNYYQQAIDRLNKNSPTYQRDVNSYQSLIQALGS